MHLKPVLLPILKDSNEYQYMKCTAILISIQNTEAVLVTQQDIEVFFSINIHVFCKTHFDTSSIKLRQRAKMVP